MSQTESKTIFFWSILVAFILSLLVIFVTPYFLKTFEELSFRLLIAFSIFFGTVIIILLIILFRKEETQDVIKEKIAKKELEKEYKKIIDLKVKKLKQKFNNAMKIIRKSSLYRFKSKYELPWYLIMGERNEGKTTFIESSGLNFPINYEDKYTNEEDESFKWYFAEHAIFVDLAGNYIEQKENPEDSVIWNYFLKFFIKRRWKRPINGIILSVSVDTLLNKSNKELEHFAKNLRDRFDELSKAFMSSIPIYLVVTKSDKIEGFNEYFNSIALEERDEILGVTFNIENIDSGVVKPEFESLLKRLNSSVLDKMHFEWDGINKGKIFLFGEKISEVFEKTTMFVDMCFSQTRYRKSLMLRGVYFTSVVDDFKMKNESKALFVKNLLADIIFPESEIIKIDDNYRKRIRRNQIITYLISISFISCISFYMLNSFMKTNDKLIMLEKNYQEYLTKRAMTTPVNDFKDVLALYGSLQNIRNLEKDIYEDGFFNFMFFKFEDRSERLTQLYYEDLLNVFLPKVIAQIESDIKHGLKDFDKTWDSTKAYLMLEILEKRDIKYLEKYMAKSWQKEYENNENLNKTLTYHWINLLNHGFSSYSIDKSLLKTARGRLIDSSTEILTYKDWKNSFSELNSKEFSFANILESNVSLFSGTDYKIPALFTKEGYEAVLKNGKKTLDEILLNNWIIGKKVNLSDKEKEEYYNRIISLYFTDYRKYWSEAISKLNILGYTEIGALNNQLAILSSSDSPVIAILKAIKENTELYTPTEKVKMDLKNSNSTISNIASKIPVEQVEQLDVIDARSIKNLRNLFKPYNDLLDENYQAKGVLVSLFTEFNKTYQTMSLMNSAVNFDEDAFKIISNRVEGKSAPMIAQLNLIPPQIKRWYEIVMQSNWKFLLKGAKFYINQKYKEELFAYFEERLKNKYPLNRKNEIAFVKLDDFNEFFKKGGILDEFYNKYVANFVNINYENSTFTAKNIDGNSLSFSKTFIENLTKAEKIRKIFFKNDGSFGIVASIKPHDLGNSLATMEFVYDGITIFYEHGPILNKKIVWPPQTLNNSIKFNLYDLTNKIVVENYIDNDWSLFKFIDKSELINNTNNSLIFTPKNNNFKSSLLLEGSISSLFKNNSPLNFDLKEGL